MTTPKSIIKRSKVRRRSYLKRLAHVRHVVCGVINLHRLLEIKMADRELLNLGNGFTEAAGRYESRKARLILILREIEDELINMRLQQEQPNDLQYMRSVGSDNRKAVDRAPGKSG